MNKQKKQFVVVVILMAVCIIGYFGVGKFYKNQEEKESENKEATAITAFELKDYEKITAFNYIANGTSITLTKDSDGKWHDSSDASVNISKDSVETDMLAKLVSVTADEKIAKKDALMQILQQTYRPLDDSQAYIQTLNLIDQLLNSIPVYKMGCNISQEAVEIAYEAMKITND